MCGGEKGDKGHEGKKYDGWRGPGADVKVYKRLDRTKVGRERWKPWKMAFAQDLTRE